MSSSSFPSRHDAFLLWISDIQQMDILCTVTLGPRAPISWKTNGIFDMSLTNPHFVFLTTLTCEHYGWSPGKRSQDLSTEHTSFIFKDKVAFQNIHNYYLATLHHMTGDRNPHLHCSYNIIKAYVKAICSNNA